MLSLAGCGAPGEAVPPSADRPISVEDAGFELYYAELEPQGIIVSCFDAGAGKSRVLSCFQGGQDISKDELRPSRNWASSSTMWMLARAQQWPASRVAS